MRPVEDLLPQAPPMVLLSGWEPQTAENAVTAYVDVTPSSPFFEAASGGVPSCVALEYMAQTMALLVGILRQRRGESPRIGFVLGSRKLEIFTPRFACGARYRIEAACGYEDDAFGAFDCRIVDAEGRVCAAGTLTAFQPEEGDLP